ncbi:MAG: nucleoside monophosphate kinase, partial [Candidatus Kapaibacteriota bacterium]
VNIDVDDATITERLLSRGRADDTAEIIANRLDVYRQETAPLLEYYSAVDSLLVTVNGVGDVQDVNQRILDTI